MTRGRTALAFDRPADFLPRFVEAAELAECDAEIVPRPAFIGDIADLDILVHGLPVKGRGFLRAVENIIIQVPQLKERARLPGDISEPHH